MKLWIFCFTVRYDALVVLVLDGNTANMGRRLVGG